MHGREKIPHSSVFPASLWHYAPETGFIKGERQGHEMDMEQKVDCDCVV